MSTTGQAPSDTEQAEGATPPGGAVHGGRLVARALQSRGVDASVHPLRRPPVLDLRRLQGRGDRDRRHPPRAVGRLGGRGLREGDPRAGRRGADRRPRGDQRDERDRRRAAQPLAARRARRPGAGDALGLGLAPGDRPPAVRLAADQVGRDGQGDRRRSPALTARGDRRGARASRRGPTFVDYPLDVVFTEAEAEVPSRAGAIAPASRPMASRRPPRSWPSAERPAIMAGTGLYWAHGEDELRAARRGARHPGLPQRHGPRLPARRPRALLLAAPAARA